MTAPTCIACNKPVRDGDAYYEDVNEGPMHAECCGPEPESFTGADGERLKPGDPIPAPGIYRGLEAPLSTAHTATAGDGGERVRQVKRGTEYEVLGEATAQVSYDRIGSAQRVGRPLWNENRLTVYRCAATGNLWCRFTDEFRDGRFETIAQAPAVQAPAREDEPLTSTEAVALWEAEQRLAASPTPTDAQPKAARPVGDEAEKQEAAEEESYAIGRRDGYEAGIAAVADALQLDSDYRVSPDPGRHQPTPDHLLDRIKDYVENLTSPTTGQETVATPRDGGVREALADAPEDEAVILFTEGEWVGEARMLRDDDAGAPVWTWANGTPVHPNNKPLAWQRMPRFTGGVDSGQEDASEIERLNHELDVAKQERNAAFRSHTYWAGEAARSAHVLAELRAALSAPGSSGPGETSGPLTALNVADALDAFWNAALGAELQQSSVVGCIAEGISAIAAQLRQATPSPAQEPGTGDTGEVVEAQACRDCGKPLTALEAEFYGNGCETCERAQHCRDEDAYHRDEGAPSDNWLPGMLALNARYEFEGAYPAFGQTAYVQRVERHGKWTYLAFGPAGTHTYSASVYDRATPATTAETRRPAEGAR